MADQIAPAPVTRLLVGRAAEAELSACIARAFDDDATGGVFGYLRESMHPEIVHVDDENDPRLDDDTFEMIVVDSGNASGDAWKYVHHVATRSGMFVVETPSR